MHRKTPVPETLIKLQAEACNFIKKKTLAQAFLSVNFAKFLRTQVHACGNKCMREVQPKKGKKVQ